MEEEEEEEEEEVQVVVTVDHTLHPNSPCTPLEVEVGMEDNVLILGLMIDPIPEEEEEGVVMVEEVGDMGVEVEDMGAEAMVVVVEEEEEDEEVVMGDTGEEGVATMVTDIEDDNFKHWTLFCLLHFTFIYTCSLHYAPTSFVIYNKPLSLSSLMA